MAELNSARTLAELDGPLPAGEVHVWLVNLELQAATISKLASLLNPEEHQRAAQFEVASARRQFIASHGFLRIVLGKYLGIEPAEIKFRLSPHGKPELAESTALHFNLSHTEGLAAIAASGVGPVGVDVERIRDEADVLGLAERFFSKKEAAWVRSHVGQERVISFFTCWTAKEAYVKAHGGGLSIPLDGFAAMPDADKPKLQLEFFADAAEARRWSLWPLTLPSEFRGAVAVEGAASSLRLGWAAEL